MASRSQQGENALYLSKLQTEAEKRPIEMQPNAKLDSVEVSDGTGFAQLMTAGILPLNSEEGWCTGRECLWIPNQALRAQLFPQVPFSKCRHPVAQIWLSTFPWPRLTVLIQRKTTYTKRVRPGTDGTECLHRAAWGYSARELADGPFPFSSLFFRSTMSSTLPWPGARPTQHVSMGYGLAWCMWSRCELEQWLAMASSVARCVSRL